jgi:hypothetical protein
MSHEALAKIITLTFSLAPANPLPNQVAPAGTMRQADK